MQADVKLCMHRALSLHVGKPIAMPCSICLRRARQPPLRWSPLLPALATLLPRAHAVFSHSGAAPPWVLVGNFSDVSSIQDLATIVFLEFPRVSSSDLCASLEHEHAVNPDVDIIAPWFAPACVAGTHPSVFGTLRPSPRLSSSVASRHSLVQLFPSPVSRQLCSLLHLPCSRKAGSLESGRQARKALTKSNSTILVCGTMPKRTDVITSN